MPVSVAMSRRFGSEGTVDRAAGRGIVNDVVALARAAVERKLIGGLVAWVKVRRRRMRRRGK